MKVTDSFCTPQAMPTLHWFNPAHDLALAADDANYQPPSSARKMADDLCTLPLAWATAGDVVVVDSIARAEAFVAAQSWLPQVRFASLRGAFPQGGEVHPWGWDKPLCKQLRLWGGEGVALPSAECLEAWRALSSRALAVTLLQRLTAADKNLLGVSTLCTNEEAIRKVVELHAHTLLKAPWSGSGKGLRQGHGRYEAPLTGWCRKVLAAQGAVVVEPRYERHTDFAMEFLADGNGSVTFGGYSLFLTDNNGVYHGNILADDAHIEARLAAALPHAEAAHVQLQQLQQTLERELSTRVGSIYRGPLGVDMMIARTSSEEAWRVHPCVEVNLRMNMGWVAHSLAHRYLQPGGEGCFCICFHAADGAAHTWHQQHLQQYPAVWHNGYLQKGYCALNSVNVKTQYIAYMLVE